MGVLIFSKIVVWNVSHFKRILEGTVINVLGLHVKYLLVLSDFNETRSLLDGFLQSLQISYFMKIHPVGAELFHADR